jgi:hypothetical protein
MLGVKPVRAILQEAISELVVKRPGNACFSAGLAHIAEFFGSPE